jgi:hypothetical protein
MAGEWVILHGGALGDLVLTIQLALRLPGVGDAGVLRVISRTNPGDLSGCRPSIVRRSSEGLGLQWLYGDHDDPAPERLREAVRGTRVLNALGGVHTIVHHRLAALEPAAVYSIDPRPRDGVQRHITQQWQTQLEAQGLLVPKCVHQRPGQRGLGVPEDLRRRGWELLGNRSPKRERGTSGVDRERALACASGSDTARGDTVVIHPGSGGRAKCWPLAGFVSVGRRVLARAAPSAAGGEESGNTAVSPPPLMGWGTQAVCFVVGPAETEQWPAAELAEFRVLECPEPDELVAILAGARAFVGNDAGPTHLAALLGTPTAALFGPTSASIWHPVGPNVCVFEGDAKAQPERWGIEAEAVVAWVQKQR